MRKNVLVTGAGSEIGINTVKFLLNSGYNVIATETINEIRKVDEVINELGVLDNQFIKIHILDLEDTKGVIEFGEFVKKTYNIHCLINIAGINIMKDFFSWSAEELRKVMDINFIGTTLLSQKVAENMILNNIAGSIIFIASQHGIVANYKRIPYCVSKAALIQLSKTLALELADFNIRVNSISPTYVLTEKNKHILQSNLFRSEELVNIPLSKYAHPKSIVNGICFLMNEEMITGHNLVIDGGWTIK